MTCLQETLGLCAHISRVAGLGEAIEDRGRASGGAFGDLELEGSNSGGEVGAGNKGMREKGQLVVLFAKGLSLDPLYARTS